MMKKLLFILSLLILLKPGFGLAVGREGFSFGGVVYDSTGTLLEGTHQITFSIYTTAESETPLWDETQTVKFSQGVYSVTLGSVTQLADTLFDNTVLFLGIQIDADSEMTPRLNLSAVPWAMQANVATTALSLAQNVVTSESIAPGAIESASIATGAIGPHELAASGVTSGTYSNATITVDADGRITAASTGFGGGAGDITGVFPGQGIIGGGPSGDVVISLAPGGVLESNLSSGSVTADKIGTGAVTADKLGADAVTSAKILDGTISGGDLAASLNYADTLTAAGLNITGTSLTLDSDNAAAGANQFLLFNRGTDNAQDASIIWNETSDLFQITTDGTVLARLQGADPVVSTDFTTKSYVDTLASGAGDITAVNTASGSGLSGGATSGAVSLQIAVDSSTIEISTNTLQVKDLGITNAKINDVAATKISGTLTDAQVSDTITVGALGSVNDSSLSANVSKLGASIDLASEVTGLLPLANITDNATTTFALFAGGAGGDPAYRAIADADIPNTITIDLATSATALAANGSNCTAGNYALGVDASGASEGCTADDDTPDSDSEVPNAITVSGGTIENSIIGAVTPVAGTFSTVTGKTSFIIEDPTAGTKTVTVKSPDSLAADYTLTLPADDGTSNQVLTTDGAGVLSWSTSSGGDMTAVNTASGSGLSGGNTSGAADLQVVVDSSTLEISTNTLRVKDVGITDAKINDVAATKISGSITDAQVSNTLTSSIFVGSGSSSNAIDLATAEVAGVLPLANLTDNATTTFALFAGGAGGDPAYRAIADADIPNNITIDAATTATNFSGSLTGDVSGTQGATVIGAGKVTNAMLAGSIAASNLIGTDITTVGTVTSGTWNGTTIAVANGGTGDTTLTAHGVLIGEGTSAVAITTAGTSTQVLKSGGASADPAWTDGGTMMFTGNSGNAVVNNTTRYFPINGGVAGNATDSSAGTRNLVSRSGTLKNLYVILSGAIGSGKTGTVTVFKNGSSTSLAVTLNTTGTSFSDTADTFTVVAGDEVGIQVTTTGNVKFSWACDFTY